jgi:ABC-type transporter Mla subunit MlaD
MKCETMNSLLTFVLGAFVVLGVIFALQTIFRTREFRSLQVQAANINANYIRLQALASDVNAYNQKYPSAELTHILQIAR